MNNVVLAITEGGRKLAAQLVANLKDCRMAPVEGQVAEEIRNLWPHCDGIICIMAAGIVVRSIAPLLKDKTTDPCVVVLDEQGRYAISLLSGHIGGGNELARRVAEAIGGNAVITTASDVLGKTAVDLWIKRNKLFVVKREKLTEISAKLVNEGKITVYSGAGTVRLPRDFKLVTQPQQADIILSYAVEEVRGRLCCVPRVLYLGIGCNRGTSCGDIELSFEQLCQEHNIRPQAVAGIATIDIKNDEEGIVQFARKNQCKLHFYPREQINTVAEASFSQAAMQAVGAKGVAEPAAILAARGEGEGYRLLIPKMKWKDVTLAVAERKITQWV